MNDKMRDALVVALSPFSVEQEESKLAAIEFFTLARKEGMVLDDFLSLKALAKLRRPEDKAPTSAPSKPLFQVFLEEAAGIDADGHPLPSRKAPPEFDWMERATWLTFRPGHPQRIDHQTKFRNAQGQKTRQGTLTADIGLEEMCQHYFHFGKYDGLYMVEVPSSYLTWLLENGGSTTPRASLVYGAVLDARDSGDLPDPPDDRDASWQPLADLV